MTKKHQACSKRYFSWVYWTIYKSLNHEIPCYVISTQLIYVCLFFLRPSILRNKLLVSYSCLTYISAKRRDSAVGIANGYRLDDQGIRVRVPVVVRIFTSFRSVLRSTQPPIQWVPAVFPPGVKLSRKRGSVCPLPIRLHGVVLNYLSIGTTLSFIHICPSFKADHISHP
jgi:hypothetical protein